MEQKHLRENRLHGNPSFPFGAYRQENGAGEPILEPHWHDEAEFLWVESGKAAFHCGLRTYVLQPGEGLFIPGGTLHGGYPVDDDACTYRAAVFGLDWLADSRDLLSRRYLVPLQQGAAALPERYGGETEWGRRTVERLTRLFDTYEGDDPAREWRIKAELLLLFADFVSLGMWESKDTRADDGAAMADRLKEVLAYIARRSGYPLTVPELADVAGLSAGHFNRVFKAYLRKTPMEYINRYRIERAADYLRQPGKTVSEAALEAGFGNFSYFSKKFKAIYGCSPSDFRKN